MSPASSGDSGVSVVVVTWNSASTIAELLDSLMAPTGCALEVVVVDNASSDATVELVRSHPRRARLIENEDNRGLAAGNNQGIEASSMPWILICNPDVVIDAGAVDAMVDVLRRRPRAAFVVPRLRDPDGTPSVSAGSLPTFLAAFTNDRIGSKEPFWWRSWQHDREQVIPRGAEACYLVRRQALDDIGLQDERFWLDWEGIDWAARVVEHGWETWFTPDAGAVHIGGISIRQARFRSVVGSHWGMYRYFSRRSHRAVRPFLAAAITARGLAKLALVAARRPLYERAHDRLRSQPSDPNGEATS